MKSKVKDMHEFEAAVHRGPERAGAPISVRGRGPPGAGTGQHY